MQEKNPNTDSTTTPTSDFNKQQTIKAVFFDIDGTLISFNTRTIPESAVLAIQKLQEQGIRVIVATGRSIQAVTPIRHLGFDGYVTFNGSACYDKDGNQLSRYTISPDSISRLLHYTENREINFVLMYENTVAVNLVTPEIIASQTKLKLPVPPVLDRTNPDIGNVLQANVFIGPEEEAAFMQTVMPDCVAARWTPLFADVNPAGISKKIGLELFCSYFGLDVSETMAFGDGGNDITMLQYAGIGVAMGNAGANVKSAADYITTDADEDGIWKALEYFGVIE
ncbi:Cof-type HAD-IIB family hydrolase [Fluviicola sp.]|uniref:Cof-type HAD-IIB family hydrolase n=1 Tax=Fluviicola sp. TaxID=1917219 RepID=UPI0031DD3F65